MQILGFACNRVPHPILIYDARPANQTACTGNRIIFTRRIGAAHYLDDVIKRLPP